MPSHCTLHCARRCRLLGACAGALSSHCDAAASGAHRARLLRARRGYLVAWLVSAAAARLLWSTSGPKVPAGASAGGSRLTPGGGQAIPRARPLLGVRWAAPAAIARRASLPRRGPRAASSAVATPRVAPGPAHAGSQVAPAYGDAFRAANAGMGPRIRLGTGRAGAVARGAQVVPRLLRDLFGPQVARERSVDGHQVFSGWHAASEALFGTISARRTFTLLIPPPLQVPEVP